MRLLISLGFTFFFFFPLHGKTEAAHAANQTSAEIEVHLISLPFPLNQSKAQLSGLAWCHDELVLLPQYPEFSGEAEEKTKVGRIYRMAKPELEKAIAADSLDYKPNVGSWMLVENGLREQIQGFDGFEAIACRGEEVWLTAEFDMNRGETHSYLIPGGFQGEQVVLRPQDAVLVKSQTGIHNIADEALLFYERGLISVHEFNSQEHREPVYATCHSLDSGSLSYLSFADVPYRLTDATEIDSSGRFWMSNFFYTGDEFMSRQIDPLFASFAVGETHAKSNTVERLVEFKIEGTEIALSGRAPIQLKLASGAGRNWEGIARYGDKGLLVVTDEYPQTYFGFVPFPPES